MWSVLVSLWSGSVSLPSSPAARVVAATVLPPPTAALSATAIGWSFAPVIWNVMVATEDCPLALTTV